MKIVLREIKSDKQYTIFFTDTEGFIGISNITVMQMQHPKVIKIPRFI